MITKSRFTKMMPATTSRLASVRRPGAIVIEAALLTPLLLIIAMGVIEIGQFINVAQTLSNASRVAGRHACRDFVSNVDEVEDVVIQYVAQSFPGLEPSEVAPAVTVSVHLADGTQLYDDDLATLETGEQMYALVSLDFSAVKWAGAIEYWQLNLEPVACYSRRE